MSKLVGSVYKWSMHRGTEVEPSREALADRARREKTPDTRDVTGRLLGDPPPGRSALDRKRAAEARRAAMPKGEILSEHLAAGVGSGEVGGGNGDGEREHD